MIVSKLVFCVLLAVQVVEGPEKEVQSDDLPHRKPVPGMRNQAVTQRLKAALPGLHGIPEAITGLHKLLAGLRPELACTQDENKQSPACHLHDWSLVS